MMEEILEVQREEHDRQAVRLLKSDTIIGLIVVDNNQLELSGIAFLLSFEGKTKVPATIAIVTASHSITQSHT